MRNLLVYIALFPLITFVAAAGQFVPFDGVTARGGMQFEMISSNIRGAEISLTADGIMVDNLEAEGEPYARLYWEDSGLSGQIGQPLIPVYRFFLEIPNGAEIIPTVISSARLEFSLNELRAAGRILPVQPPLEKIPGLRAEFQIDRTAYDVDSYSHAPVIEVESYPIIRGRQLAVIVVRPLDYNPAQGKVAVYSGLRLRMDFRGGDMAATRSSLNRFNSIYFNYLVKGLVKNSGVFSADSLPDPPCLLVISPDIPEYLNTLQPLLDWKRGKGFHTSLVTTNQTGATTSQIKSYILNAYNTWAAPPTFVLLVGDVQYIPNWIGGGSGSPETDLNYALLEGQDYFPDIGVSRFSPSGDSDLRNMVNKTREYEQVGWSGNDTWERYATFMASTDNYQVSEGTHEYVINTYLLPAGYTVDRLYSRTYNATTQQVTNAFNAGRSQGTFSGHGSETSWADGPPFSQGNVRALTNEVYPVIQSYACLTGRFARDECFGETWIRHSRGALAFWGSSVTSYWDEDDILEKRVYQGIYDNQIPGDTVNFTWINGFTDYGKVKLYEYYGHSGTVQRYFEMYNVLGDGSVDMWTSVPRRVIFTHPTAVFLGASQAQVSVSGHPQWALVCARSTVEGDVYASAYVDASGSATLTFNPAPTLPGYMVFTVTGHDVQPVVDSVALAPATGPYVVFDSLSIDDSMGNNNGRLDFNEEVQLTIRVENVGVAPANNVEVRISSEDIYVTILDSLENYGSIPAGATAAVPNAFRIRAAGNVPDMRFIGFTLTAADSQHTWESPFTITAHAPDVRFESLVITEITGNNNGLFDPGETVDFQVNVRNNGSCTVETLISVLSATEQLITIPADTFVMRSVSAGGTAALHYGGIQSHISMPQGSLVNFYLNMTGNGNYAAEDSFQVIVGDSLCLPTGPDNYGYSAYDPLDAPEMPIYNWVEICADSGGPGTLVNFTQDDQVFHFALPFSFRYYGQSYDSLTIAANGWIAPGIVTQDDYSNSGIPNPDGPPRMIAPYWEDLSPQRTNSGRVWLWNDAAHHRYIVEYNHIEQYRPTGYFETFEVILYHPAHYPTSTGDGRILFQYKDMSTAAASEGTIGIENQAQNDGLQYFFDGDYDAFAHRIENLFAIMVTTPAGAQPPLTVTMTPNNPPIVIPSGGGTFEYDAAITNNSQNAVNFDAWIDVILPNGNVYGPLLLRTGFTIPGGATIIRHLNQMVPGYAPAGSYLYQGHIGAYPDSVVTEDSFPFSKLPGEHSGDNPFNAWTLSGWDEGSPASAAPQEYSLWQNHPNPFNPATEIRFALPERAEVKLKIYNIQGKEVAALVEGALEAGWHTITFDGSRLASGIYFCKLETAKFTSVKKMLLVK